MGEDGRADPPPETGVDAAVPLDVIPLHSTNLLTVLDRDGVVRYESPSIERLLGYEQDELVGEPVAGYFHPDDREAVVEAFRSVVESDEYTVEAVEYRHAQADGTYRWVESVASADPTPAGHYVVNTRDVSHRKTRERALERTNERLEAFASVVSHDLRNPLNVAAGQLQLARETGEGEHLDAVARAHERMERLIDDVLTFALAGDETADPGPVSLADLAEACWQHVETGRASLSVGDELVLRADEARLRQLLENLIGNAVDHGGEQVTVGVGRLPGRDGFYVEDDGPGIPTDERDRVFESGFSTREDGTGLGLATVSQVASAHGWALEVTDSDAGGARIEVTGVEVVD